MSTEHLQENHRCSGCGNLMVAKSLTKTQRNRGYRYGVVWHCNQCGHSCWTDSTLREHRRIKEIKELKEAFER